MRFSFTRFLAAFLLAAPAVFAAEAPGWLVPLQKRARFDYAKAPAVILLDEQLLTAERDGIFTRRSRHAVRILASAGKEQAVARVRYDSGSQKVKSAQAWLIRPDGEVIVLDRKRSLDTALFSNARELYGEARQLILQPEREVEVGSVFAYEATVTENSFQTQDVWSFQDELPVEQSTLTITVPDGWRVTGRTFNHEPVPPRLAQNTTTWQLEQLPFREHEPLGPPDSASSPRLVVDIVPPAGVKAGKRRPFPSWQSIAAYLSPFYEAAATADPGLTAKAASLTAGAASEWDRIRLLARYVQKTTYISINLNMANGGGFIPRPAASVLQCNYGDCKDKVTLLRSLLRAQGIASYALIVDAGNSRRVIPDWPSPGQFNHCIVAIRADASAPAGAVSVDRPVLGRLLLFDPTSEHVPVGLLPVQDMDDQGLIIDAGETSLVVLPRLEPRHNRYERRIAVALTRLGAVTGSLEEDSWDQASAAARAERAGKSDGDYRKVLERQLATFLPALHVTKVETRDDPERRSFHLTLDFDATPGKPMRDSLLIFRPVLLPRRSSVTLKKGLRTQPVLVPPLSFREISRIALPEGFLVEEMYPDLEQSASFGSYTVHARIAEGQLLIERTMELKPTTIPPAEYETVRAFFDKIQQSEQTPLVLKRTAK